MKGIFIIYESLDHMTGINKKIRDQISAFNKKGLDCEYFLMSPKIMPLFKIFCRMPFVNIYPSWEYSKDFQKIDFIYLRRPYCMTKSMRTFLKQVREKNPKIKIVLELPTYPYDKELLIKKRDIPFLIKDIFNRKKLKGLVDKIAILTEEKNIFDIPTIKFKNGINIDLVSARKPKKLDDDCVHMCAVALFADWHGYERILYGIRDYYFKFKGKRKVMMHFIGKGSVLNNYKKIVSENHLNDYVIFHGMKNGEELDKIYDYCDLGIGALGCYKKNIYYSCSLKMREYLAKGLPVISGCKEDLFEKGKYKYFIEFANDESNIDISKVLEFYDDIYGGNESKEEVIHNVRNYAVEKVDMSSAMESIVAYLKEK